MSTEPSDIGPASTSDAARASSYRLSTRLALLMFCVVAAPCLLLDALANFPPTMELIRKICWEESIWKNQIPLFCFYNHFFDSDDYVVHEELPASDFSRGSVCMVGASSMSWGPVMWRLPAEQRTLIHNFAIKGFNHADQFDLLRFLVDQEGLLRAGGDKTLVVFGLSYHLIHNVQPPDSRSHELFTTTLTRRGFYRVDADATAHDTHLHPWVKRLIVERTKVSGLLREIINLIYTPLKSRRVTSPDIAFKEWTSILGPRWEDKLRWELDTFARTLDYLSARRVPMLVVALPERPWNEKMPCEAAYMKGIQDICRRKRVELLDLRKSIPEQDFADSVHLNPKGMEKLHGLLIPRCVDFLQSTGALSVARP